MCSVKTKSLFYNNPSLSFFVECARVRFAGEFALKHSIIEVWRSEEGSYSLEREKLLRSFVLSMAARACSVLLGAKLTNNKCLLRKGGYRRSNKKKNDIKARQILFFMNNARNTFVRAFCYLRCIIDISK